MSTDHRFIIQANNELILLKKDMARDMVMDLLQNNEGDIHQETNKIIYNLTRTTSHNRKYIIGFRDNRLDYVLKSN